MPGVNGCVVFDFDGTLVDSARGILTGMALALQSHHITPRVALEPGIIGPPLLQTLRLISGLEDDTALGALAAEFKRCYDGGGYRNTDPYPGVTGALQELHAYGTPLYLATNKRGTPTRLILDHLGWAPLFSAVYCLDECVDCADKAAMLARLLSSRALAAPNALYVGDTDSDARAAAANGMPYIHVAWGYGGDETNIGTLCSSPEELPALALRLLPQGYACPEN
ncbi:MAG TPA: HAD hydrolase-like protein [Rhodocyclaceae bacterium]